MTSSIIAALVGGLLTLAGVLVSAGFTTGAQLKITAINFYLTARLESYRELEAALKGWSNAPSRASCAAVYQAANAASLVASNDTINILGEVVQRVRDFEASGALHDLDSFTLAHLRLIDSIRNDLMTVRMPKVQKPAREHTKHHN